jgi:ParB family chromosome partitioning protein
MFVLCFDPPACPMSTPKAKPRLGRGLSSLISVSELPVEAALPEAPTVAPSAAVSAPVVPAESNPPAEPNHQPLEIPVESVRPNPHQPRKQFDDANLQSLAASIKSSGLVQPIVVRPAKGQPAGTYELIAGERRLRAAKAAGLATVPALIREVDAFEQAQLALIENVQREDLNPIDRAQAYRTLIDQLGLTQAELAGRIGEDRSSIANYLRLLDLAEPVRDMVRDGRLSLGHAKILAGVSDPVQQQELAERVIGQGLSVRNLERLLQDAPAAPVKNKAEPTAHVKDLEQSLTSQLGLKVQLRTAGKKGKGRLVIHYGSLDQFDALLERLGCKAE